MYKKSQITVFIIVGILILFVFLALILITSKLQKGQLEEQREEVVTGLIKKEALRLYVEDCLFDALEEGLVLLGQQGRIWADQSGGRKEFIESQTGVTYNEDHIFYGLTRANYNDSKAYPCANEANSPFFCAYTYPQEAKFGQLELKWSALQEDLKYYLINRTVSCVENFTKENISSQAELTSTELTLNLDITNDGISVKAAYPLSFQIKGENYFHLGEFNFFYPTAFKSFLDAAVIYPLQYDSRYLDFAYTPENLLAEQFTYGSSLGGSNCMPDENNLGNFLCAKNTFADLFSRLGIKLEIRSLSEGDDLFVFSAPNILLRQEGEYQFRFARQNRAPALDYVQRLSCQAADYDYLVIPGSEEYNSLDLALSALDPDEEEVVYAFKELPSAWKPFASIDKERLQVSREHLFPGRYSLEAVSFAQDEPFLSDNQTVRILVDRPVEMKLNLRLPYESLASQIGEDYYLVSKEDPVFLDLTFPQRPLTEDLDTFTLTYFGQEEDFSFQIQPWPEYRQQDAYSTSLAFPQQRGQFLISEENLQKIIEPSFLPRPFSEVTSQGRLVLDYTTNYCGQFSLSEQEEIKVDVRACVPSQNPKHPYPFIPGTAYYQYQFPLDSGSKTDFSADPIIDADFNPFLASHNCCDPLDWSLYSEEEKCFTNPEPGCYGKIKDYTALSGFGGYVLETQSKFCDGLRGNICGGAWSYNLWSEAGQEKLVCGDSSKSGCKTEIESRCRSQSAFGYLTLDEGSKGWCYGTMGCTNFCSKEVVDGRASGYIGETLNLNALALSSAPRPRTTSELGFSCGCDKNNLDQPCDANYNGRFSGRCSSGPEGYFCAGDV